jgi:hypothetical protein
MSGTLVVLMLAVWVGATGILLTAGPVGKFLWVPVVLAVAGVFCSTLPLTISSNTAVAVNGAILLFFVTAMAGILKQERRLAAVRAKL